MPRRALDPGSSTASPGLSPAGSLEALAARAGVTFTHLAQAHTHAAEKIVQARAALTPHAPHDVSIVMFGSWARGELTEGSDNDWAILTPTRRSKDEDVDDLAARCQEMFNEDGKAPGSQALFGVPFEWRPLATKIGLDKDTNRNLTRRMLTLLESVPLTGPARDHCWQAILDRYLQGIKNHWPPRFLLNDTIRYWRTICVDFEGKHKGSGGDDPKWVMRNAKLRTSRKMLFAGGLIPTLFCRLRKREEIPGFLAAQFSAPASDRVAWAFLELGLVDEGARCLTAYDEWIGLLQQKEFRGAMAELRADTRKASPEFALVRDIGERLDGGLLALLFDSGLGADARRFLVL